MIFPQQYSYKSKIWTPFQGEKEKHSIKNQFIPFIRHTCKFFSVLVTVDNELSKANRFFTCNINKAKYLLATKRYPPPKK